MNLSSAFSLRTSNRRGNRCNAMCFTPFSWMLQLLLLIGVTGCATVKYQWPDLTTWPRLEWQVPEQLTTRLEQAPVCCAALSDLPYQSIPKQGRRQVEIGDTSPAFLFDTGKSRFAAFRLPAWPRPLTLGVDSYRTDVPGGLGRLISELRGLIFHPVMLILDEHFQVNQVIDRFQSDDACRSNAFMPALSASLDIETPPEQSAYLVILTSDALRNETGRTLCGGKLHGFSPVGKLDITLGSLGFGDGKVAYKGPFVWYRNANGREDVGVFSGMFREPGTLLITGDGVHYVEWTGKGYVERFSASHDRLVSVKVDSVISGRNNDLLVLGIAGEAAGQVHHHTFATTRASSASEPEALIEQHIGKHWFTEKIGLVMLDTPPAVEILDNKPDSGAAGRIGESAVAGGVVLAAPCALCAAGPCPPEALAPCAALFTVGAAVGGIVGIGNELLGGGLKTVPQPPRIPATAAFDTVPAVQAAFDSLVGGQALQKCILRHLPRNEAGEAGKAAWSSQGRRADLVQIALDRDHGDTESRYRHLNEEGFSHVVEGHIARLSLVPQGIPGQAVADMPVRLRFEAGFRFIDLYRQRERQVAVGWQTEPHSWSEWSAGDRRNLNESLAEGCNVLARKIVEEAEKAWREH